MSKWLGILMVLLFLPTMANSQDVNLGDSRAAELLDSLLIDRDSKNWSLRFFMNAKEQRFRLSGMNHKLSYVPNNPFGVGVGFATQKLIADLAFNIKNKDKTSTERFDVQVAFILKKKHLFDAFLQSYQGFNLRSGYENLDNFRTDLKSSSLGVNYVYLFNGESFSLTSLKSGLSEEKRTMVSFGFGGFAFVDNFEADSSLVPHELLPIFNEEARVTGLTGYGAGVLGGVYSLFALPSNFFISLNVTPGIGLVYKEVEAEEIRYKPTDLLIYKLGMFGAIGYRGKRFYTNVTVGMSTYKTSLDFGNSMALNITNAKLAFGYRLGQKK